MSIVDDYLAQVARYQKAGSLYADLLPPRPDLRLGKQGLLDLMNEAHKQELARTADPVAYYQANPQAQGLIDVAPEMDLIDLASGGASKAMFLGAKALKAPLDMMGMGRKMLAQGADPKRVKKLTGIESPAADRFMWEISDNKARLLSPDERTQRSFEMMMAGKGEDTFDTLGGLLKHDELFDNYPDLANVRVKEDASLKGTNTRAGYNHKTDTILVNPDVIRSGDQDDLMQSILHETQHAIQWREDLPAGASAEAARGLLNQANFSENIPFIGGAARFKEAARELGPMEQAALIGKLDDMVKKDSIQPRAFNSSSYLYEYGNDIRKIHGPMPKKAGRDRDNWLKSAFAYARNREIEKLSHDGKYYLDMVRRDPKMFGKEHRAAKRTADKYREDFLRSNEIIDRYDELRDLHPAEIYAATSGERMARGTPARLGLTDQERRGLLYHEIDDPKIDLKTDKRWPLLPSVRAGSEWLFDEYMPK